MATARLRTRVRDFWRFYRRYTTTAAHTLSAAALAIFGLLVFVDPLFAILAIGAYVLPPILLFAVGWRPPADDSDDAEPTGARSSEPSPDQGPALVDRTGPAGASDPQTEPDDRYPASGPLRSDRDTDSDRDDGDTDSDRDGGDTDSDRDDGDTDTDG